MLVFQNVAFAYPGADLTLAHINLECRYGITAVVGASGVGKSTLVNLAAGLLTPARSGGPVLVLDDDGRSFAPPSAAPRELPTAVRAAQARQIGLVPQKPTLFPWMSVAENVALPLKLHAGKPGVSDDVEGKVRRAMERCRIAEAAEKQPAQLSGGMQTRAALARALVHEPRVLLLDEPFSGLDEVTREEIHAEVQATVRAVGCTALLVTHDLLEAVLLADRIAVLGRRTDGSATLVKIIDPGLPGPRGPELIGDPKIGELHRMLRAAVRETYA